MIITEEKKHLYRKGKRVKKKNEIREGESKRNRRPFRREKQEKGRERDIIGACKKIHIYLYKDRESEKLTLSVMGEFPDL